MICMALNPDKPKWNAVVVRAVFHFGTKRNRDVDGMISSLKAYMDGVTDSELIEDDRFISWLPPQHDIDKDNPHVELRFYHGKLKPLKDEELIDPV